MEKAEGIVGAGKSVCEALRLAGLAWSGSCVKDRVPLADAIKLLERAEERLRDAAATEKKVRKHD